MKGLIPVLCVAALAACGTDPQQRAATGGLTGAGIGALAGGPLGAAIGLAAGGLGGYATPVGADRIAREGTQELRAMTPDSLKSNETSGSSEPTAAGRPATVAGKPVTVLAPITPDTIKTMQTTLRHENLYDGPVDGKIGRKTRTAISEHQAKQGRPSTGELDDTTWRELTSPSAPS